jgi:PEGA domain
MRKTIPNMARPQRHGSAARFCRRTKHAVFLAALVFIAVGLANAQSGKLKTKVKPDDASVWVDGAFRGHVDQFNGPGQSLTLPAGEHEVKISIAYFEDYATRVNVSPGETTTIRQQLGPSNEPHPGPPYANAKLRCKPLVTAAVIVNGRFIGTCDEMNGPGQVLLLWEGTHEIEVTHDGYRPYKTTVAVGPSMVNKPLEIPVNLEPL